MLQEIIVGIILTGVAVWLLIRVRRSLFQTSQNPCATCATPCKLKDEINKKAHGKKEKCTLAEEKRQKN